MTTMELIENHGIGHNCLSDAYALGYSQAETDYHKQTEKDRQSAFDCGYQQGRADAIDEFKVRLLESCDGGEECIECVGGKCTECFDNRVDYSTIVVLAKKLKEEENERFRLLR